jgi:hypothetical protein
MGRVKKTIAFFFQESNQLNSSSLGQAFGQTVRSHNFSCKFARFSLFDSSIQNFHDSMKFAIESLDSGKAIEHDELDSSDV